VADTVTALLPGVPMASAKFPQLSQFAGMFTRLGQQREHDWEPMPWKGISNKVLLFDRCTGLTLELARIEKGAVFPEHYHTTVQTQFLVSGRIELKSGDVLDPGTFNIIPAGQLHGPFKAVEEAITFKYFASVPVYILPDGQTFIYREDGKTINAGSLKFITEVKAQNFIS
jgi:quercetin dioxygenase-like cupin family protein